MIEAYSVGAASQTKWPASTTEAADGRSLVEKLSLDERDYPSWRPLMIVTGRDSRRN
jgi:hypothetical protein